MPGEFYFMAVGGLGVTLAGFAGLIAALQGRQGPVAAWRIRNIVAQGFSVTLVGFATVALYGLTQDVPLADGNKVRLVLQELTAVGRPLASSGQGYFMTGLWVRPGDEALFELPVD